MEKLKPCPFCGGEARLFEEIPGGYIIQCQSCCGQIGIMPKKDAIEAWNARYERTCHVKGSYDTSDVDNRNSNAEWYFAFSCGCELYWDEPQPPNYCPNCGAKVVDV